MNGKKKIKILYEIGPYSLGGTERFLYKLVKYMNKEKFEPIAISRNAGKPLSMFRLLGIQTEVFKFKSNSAISDELLRFIKKTKIDIAQSNYYSFAVAMSAYASGIPHIWRLGSHIETKFPFLKPRNKHRLLHIISRLSQKLICPSKFIKNQFEGIEKSKVNLIYNGTEIQTRTGSISHPEAVRPKDLRAAILRFAQDDGTYETASINGHYTIGMIANFFPDKRHIDFIYAAKKVNQELSNTRFFIFGSPFYPESDLRYAKHLSRTIRDIQMQNKIILAGFLNDIDRGIEQMDLIVLPSVGEGFSNSILEAMASGKAVIASNSGGNPELVKNSETGFLVPPKDPEKLAGAMLKILKNQEKARKLGEAAKKRARRMFNITACVSKYENLYLQV